MVILLLLLLVLAAPALAQEPRMQATLEPSRVRLGQQAHLTVRLEGFQGFREPRLERVPDVLLELAESRQVAIGSQREIYLRWVLTPLRTGTIEIPPLEVESGGRLYRTDPLLLEVEDDPDAPPPPEGAQDPVFVTADVDRHEIYVGEPVLYTFRLFYSTRIFGGFSYTPPATPGFVAAARPDRSYVTAVGGEPYSVRETPILLFPHTAGPQTLGSASVDLGDRPFDPLFEVENMEFVRRLLGGDHPGVLASPEISLKVLPLPTRGRPPGFSGAVGTFRMGAALDRAEVAAGDPVTLTVTVEGEGNLNLMDPPPLPALPEFKAYDTKSSGGLDPDSLRATGKRTFTTVLVPRKPGRKTLEGLKFSYFDPSTGAYRTLQADPLTLEVTEGTNVPEEAAATPAAPGRPALKPAEGTRGPARVTTPWILAAQLAPLVALAFSGLRLARPRRRPRRGPVRDRLQRILPPGLSYEQATADLARRGVPPEVLRELRAVLDERDRAYAPGGAEAQADERAHQVLDAVERALR